jgi:uncharacterized alpha-E superfamily protein
MLSRDADSCFWIGRYIERAEATARMIDVHYHFRLESAWLNEPTPWSSILSISGDLQEYQSRYADEDERSIIQFFVFDTTNYNSIFSCIRAARENARAIREQISSEMWQCINTIYLDLREWSVERVYERSPHAFFQWVKDASHLFQGITNRTLMMGESRDFLDAGRFLERASQTARILDVRYHDLMRRAEETHFHGQTPADAEEVINVHGWIALLKSVGAYEAFRKTFHEGVTPARVAAFLILNPSFPASVRHSIGRVEDCLRRISGNREPAPSNAAERAVGKLYSQLTYLTPEEILARDLHLFLGHLQAQCNEIGSAIAAAYLQY